MIDKLLGQVAGPKMQMLECKVLELCESISEIKRILIMQYGAPPNPAVFAEKLKSHEIPPVSKDKGMPWVFDEEPVSREMIYDVVAYMGRVATEGFIVNTSNYALLLAWYDDKAQRWTNKITIEPGQSMSFEHLRIAKFQIEPKEVGDSVSIKGILR